MEKPPPDAPDTADDTPVLPDRPADETEVGWGDQPSRRDAEDYRRERPPHHE
jgi:hypothetical protein